MSTDLPFHSAVLGLRLVYDKAFDFVQEALDQEVKHVVFCWSGTTLCFDVTLAWDGEKYVELAKRGIHTYRRCISGNIEQDVVRDLLRFDEEAYRSMDVLQALDTALAELALGAGTGQTLGNNGLSFELLTFRTPYLNPLRKLYENWDNREELSAAAIHHYQARMAIGRRPLDAVDDNAPVQHYYYDGSPSPWGEEQ